MELIKDKHNAIEKALVILRLFSPNNQELSTNEISEQLGYHRATTSRILLLLKKKGFLEQNQQNRKFRLGPSIAMLSLSFNRSLENKLVQIAKPFLDDLRDTLEENVVLEVLSGRTTVRAYSAEGPRQIRLSGDIGDRLPMNAAAGAKAILAFLSPKTWDYFLDKDLPRITPNTITDLQQFKKQLKQIKSDGISTDIGEYDVDINAIGAPIFNAEGSPVAAVVVVGLPSRITNGLNPRMAMEVKTTAMAISKQLGKTDKKLT
jgi:IclR family acetate operon transcriptional repressor